MNAVIDQASLAAPDPHSGPLTPSANLRRRNRINRVAEGAATGAALLAVAVLAIVIFSVAQRGADALSIDFLIQEPAAIGSGGGIGPAILGTAMIVGVATLIAMPLGVLLAIYLTEFAAPRVGRAIRLMLDLLNGLPTIIVGLFVFGLLVVGNGQSGFAGSFALAIIMLPLIARASQEVLLLVPETLRDAANALGVNHWRMVRGVLVPAALGGIVTATLLAVARAAGETAPLIFASSIFGNAVETDFFGKAIPNIPVSIFTLSEQADPTGFTRAWGAALVLLTFILVVSLGSRALLSRNRAKLTQ